MKNQNKYDRYKIAHYKNQPSYTGGRFLYDVDCGHQTLKEAREEVRYKSNQYGFNGELHIVDSYKGDAPQTLHPTDHDKPHLWATAMNCYQSKLFR